jgi:hypothetical protein
MIRATGARRSRHDRRTDLPVRPPVPEPAEKGGRMIRKLASGGYRLYSRKKDAKTGKRKNLGTFKSLAAAQKHERAVQFFKKK